MPSNMRGYTTPMGIYTYRKMTPTVAPRGSTQTPSSRISGPIWSSSSKRSASQNALSHFNKHGAEFAGVKNSLDYVAQAQKFLRTPPPGTLTGVRQNGDIVRYNPETNVFGVMNKFGAPKTYYHLNDHSYSTNLEYFYAQF